MEHVDIGALLSAIAIFVSSFLGTKSNAVGERRRNRLKPENGCIGFQASLSYKPACLLR